MACLASTFVAADGDGYEMQMGRWSRRLAPLFIEFAGVTGAQGVLDVGCGTGNLTACLLQNPAIAKVSGIDFSPVYVAHAERHCKDTRVDFQLCDACALPYPDASFDHAMSMLVMQFIPDTPRAIREMRRVTRPGGTVAAATWDTRGDLVTYRMIFDTAAMLDQGGRDRRARAYTRPMCRPGELAKAWRDAGLISVEQDMRTIRMDFASFADFWAPAEGRDGPVAEYVATLDAQSKSRLRAAVELAYLDGEVDGPRSYAATAWVVRGTVPN